MTNLRDSEHLKTSFALYKQDRIQKNEQTSFFRLKNMAKMYFDLATEDRDFDLMPETTELRAELHQTEGR